MVLGTRRPGLTQGNNQTQREYSNHRRAIHDSETHYDKGAISYGKEEMNAKLVVRSKDLTSMSIWVFNDQSLGPSECILAIVCHIESI